MYASLCRKDPITGETNDVTTESDLRNTYTIIGFCGFDFHTVPFFHHLRESTDNAEAFAIAVESTIALGFLCGGDVLVLDNTSIHLFKVNELLEEWLCENYGIFMLTLPTRSPEMNPIEKLWNILVKRMKSHSLEEELATRIPIYILASQTLDALTHLDVFKCYKSCGYIN